MRLASLLLGLAAVTQVYARPNIVFIYTDDQGPWALGAAGNKQAWTPNIDRLIQEGAWLPNSFTVTPVCSPSRASLMTSRYGSEVGITDYIHPTQEADLGLPPETATWPELLQAAGYRTGLFGKWHLGTLPKFHPTKTGFDEFVGFLEGGAEVRDPLLEVQGKRQRFTGFTDDILTSHAVDFIRRHQREPFLVSLHHRSPHYPFLPVPPEDWERFKGLDAMIPNPEYPDLDIERAKQMWPEYLASIAGVDRSVGRIMSVLDELKIADNTVVIFTSDNGYNLGHNGIWHKGNGHWLLRSLRGKPGLSPEAQRPNMYDHSLRVPTGIRWPRRIRPGTVIRNTISSLDWYPTLLSMAGVKMQSGVKLHGRDFTGLLSRERNENGIAAAWNDDLFAEYSQHHYASTHLRCYRTPEWKLIRDFRNPGKDELYHLARDAEETTNLVSTTDEKIIAVKAGLNDRLLARLRELNDPLATRPGN